MFTLPHFIWLIAISAIITVVLIVIKKFKPSTALVQKTVFIILIIFKLFHSALSMKKSEFGGYVMDQTQLSFHLCSIQIYFVVLINVIKNEKFVKTIKSFMVPCMMIGATMALLIPTEGVSPSVPRVWQYMLIHGTLVFYGIYLMVVEKVDLSLKAFISNLKLLTIVVLLAFLMNSVLEQYQPNFLFLRQPPMEGLPLLNLNNGWYVYFITLAFIACLLVFIVHLPFIIKEIKNKKVK